MSIKLLAGKGTDSIAPKKTIFVDDAAFEFD
jgi:hypothetical protein